MLAQTLTLMQLVDEFLVLHVFAGFGVYALAVVAAETVWHLAVLADAELGSAALVLAAGFVVHWFWI